MEYKKNFLIFKSSKEMITSYILSSIVLGMLFVFLVVCFFYYTHNYYQVQGSSMYPTINEKNTAVYVTLDDYANHGDVIVAYNNENKRIVKRVIAVEGDKFAYFFNENLKRYEPLIIYSGTNKIVVLEEDYVQNKNDGYNISQNYLYHEELKNKEFKPITYNGKQVEFLVIPENKIFLLGDNRTVSLDCSNYGPISKNAVFGHVNLVVTTNCLQLFEIIAYCFGLRGTL